MIIKRIAAKAQMESEDVAAVNVRNTGASVMRARNIIMDDFKALRSANGVSIATVHMRFGLTVGKVICILLLGAERTPGSISNEEK